MQKNYKAETRRSLLLSLVVLGLFAVLAILPYQFRSEANSTKGKGLIQRTESHDEGLQNYDIREQKSEEVADALVRIREKAGKDASAVAASREDFVRGEEALKQRVPTLKVEYNNDIRIPEVIAPDVKQGRNFLTGATTGKRSEVLRDFIKDNNSLIGINETQADALKVTADYTNPDGNLSFAHLEQRINNIPVFRGEVKAGFTKSGEIVRVINNLAPGLDYGRLSTEFGDPLNAVRAAAGHINVDTAKLDLTRNSAASDDLKVTFGQGDWATTAEKMYFPTEPGVAVPAWRVLVWLPNNAYYVIVDAETGMMMWRKNITEDQTQASTYNVYTNTNAMINAADSPAPLSPGPVDPALGTQGTVIARNNVTRIGNEAPYTFNNNGWIIDGGNTTDGNAVEAGIDRDGTNGVDAPQTGNPTRTFTTTGPAWNPPPGNPAPGDDPLAAQSQRGAVIQMFYVMNLYHDEMYRLGFTEQSFNFQNDNFGRGGAGADRVSAEGQDSSGTNNANFSTPADGGRGRMQMFLWTGPTPDYDGTADADVIIHEVTHGTSNRLHGNAAGLSTNMARGMGEGWSDFYAHVLLSEPTDPVNGVYSLGGYATFQVAAGFTANYYYGIRRYPKAPIAFTGGANNKPHNAYTFSYINADCNTRLNNTNFAFARGPIGVTTCDQVHNIGEIWSSALWEVRTLFVARLGWAVGNRKTLQLVTDGMKLAPIGPTLLQERDAIIAAAAASSAAPEAAADVTDMWNGFRARGMGFSAAVTNAGTGANNTVVVDGFDSPNALITNPFTVSDSTGDNDGFPEPGENLVLSVPVTNTTGSTVTGVSVTQTGGQTQSYGDIANGATVTRTFNYTVPAGAACGSIHVVTFSLTSAVGTNSGITRSFRLGRANGAFNTANIVINDNAAANPYPSTINVSGISGPANVRVSFTGLNHTFPDDIDMVLVGPGGQKMVIISDVGGTNDWVNTDITLSDAATANLSDAGANPAGSYKPTNVDTTTDVMPAPAPAAPYENPAPAGTATFASVFGTDGAAMNGTWSLYVRDDVGIDTGNISGGWGLLFNSPDFICELAPSNKARADFDGDGKTDLSVFRPSDGNWYQQKSTAGFGAVNWGLSTDTIVPGDYDGDGKTDVAVFRPTNTFGDLDFFVLRSSNNTFTGMSWGVPSDVSTIADYDGDGKSDFAIWRPSTGMWAVKRSSDNGETYVTFGQSGDVPVHGDYDGDGKADQAVWRPNANPSQNFFFVRRSSDNTLVSFEWGQQGDVPVTGDFDGDNKDDYAVFRPSNGTWYIQNSGGTSSFINFGQSGDIVVPGDYDGDGKDDQAVYRSGTWYLNRSTGGFAAAAFGTATDKPVPRAYF